MQAEQVRQSQSEYVSGFEAKLARRGELPLPGGIESISLLDVQRLRRYADLSLEVRRLVSRSANPDRRWIGTLPTNPLVAWQFRRHSLLREWTIATVAVVCVGDVEAYLAPTPDGTPPTPDTPRPDVNTPAGPRHVATALERLSRLIGAGPGVTPASHHAGEDPSHFSSWVSPPREGGPGTPGCEALLVGVFSATGWSPQAVEALPDDAARRVVLVSRNRDGTWTIQERGGRLTALADLFDPETETHKFARVLVALRAQADTLPAGEWLDAADLAARWRVPPRLVAIAMDELTRRRDELRITEAFGHTALYRLGPQPARPGFWSRLWSGAKADIFRGELFAQQRTRLMIYRQRLWQEADTFDTRQQDLLATGRQTDSDSRRRQLAAELAAVRRELRHRRRLAEVLDHQIALLSGQLHNLELVAIGQVAGTPSIEEIQNVADQAATLLSRLGEEVRIAHDTAPEPAELSAEEQAILNEFQTGATPATTQAVLPAQQALSTTAHDQRNADAQLRALLSTETPAQPHASAQRTALTE